MAKEWRIQPSITKNMPLGIKSDGATSPYDNRAVSLPQYDKANRRIEQILREKDTSVLKRMVLEKAQALPQAERVRTAIDMLEANHTGEIRKDGVTPYLAHVYGVALIYDEVSELSQKQGFVAAKSPESRGGEWLIALLHDEIEDSTTTKQDIEEIFDREVAESDMALSKKANGIRIKDDSSYYGELATQPSSVRWIKGVDRLTNLDTHMGEESRERREYYLQETEQYIFPLVKDNPFLNTKLSEAYDSLQQTLGK